MIFLITRVYPSKVIYQSHIRDTTEHFSDHKALSDQEKNEVKKMAMEKNKGMWSFFHRAQAGEAARSGLKSPPSGRKMSFELQEVGDDFGQLDTDTLLPLEKETWS